MKFIPLTRFLGACTLLAAVSLTPASLLAAPASTGGMVTLNFVNAELDAVIKAIGQATNRTILVDPRVKGAITLVTEQPVSRAQAFETLGATLRMQGFALVEGRGFYKVVPEADAKLQGAPTTVGTSAARGDQVVTQVFRLNHESANNLVPVLRPLIAPNNTITAYPGNNTLVITDYAENLQRLGRIIAAVDAPAAGDVEVIPLKHALAVEVAALLSRALDPGAIGNADPTLKTVIIAEQRSNSVLVRAGSTARISQVRSLIAKLDQPAARSGNIWVVPLRNAEAASLAQTLRAIVAADGTLSGSGGGSAAAGAGAGAGATPVATPQATGGSGTTGSTAGAIPGSFASNNVPTTGGIIQADRATNSLVITASEPVYRNLRDVIERLDTRRAQIYVESLIIEVSSERAAELGTQWRGLLLNGERAPTSIPGADITTGSVLGAGLANYGRGLFGLAALARAMERESGVNVLSTPNLLTLDNEEAKILVGQNIGIANSQSNGSPTTQPFTTFDRKDVGVTLRIRPQISDSGLIKLQIYQEVSSVVSNVATTTNPVLNKRAIESSVLAEDGQIITLGGLIEDNYGGGIEKVPVLGNIPLIGALFRYESRSRKKTNLMVFLRPYVIRTGTQSDAIVTDRYDYIRAQQQGYTSGHWLVREKDLPVLPAIEAPQAPLLNRSDFLRLTPSLGTPGKP